MPPPILLRPRWRSRHLKGIFGGYYFVLGLHQVLARPLASRLPLSGTHAAIVTHFLARPSVRPSVMLISGFCRRIIHGLINASSDARAAPYLPFHVAISPALPDASEQRWAVQTKVNVISYSYLENNVTSVRPHLNDLLK